MKITKEEALTLAKVFHEFMIANRCNSSALVDHVEEIATAVDEFLVGDSDCADEEDSCDNCQCGGCEDEDKDDEDDEDSNEHDADSEVEADELHAMSPVKTKQGMVEFELVDEPGVGADRVDVLVDGYSEHDVTHCRRNGSKFEALDSDGEWHIYHVRNTPKNLALLFPEGDLVEVIINED